MEEQNLPKDPNKTINKEFGLTNFAVNNVISVMVLTFIIVIVGFNAYNTMPKENYPEIVMPTIYVSTIYPGNSPIDMENLVSRPIEKELKSLEGIKKVTSTSLQDYSAIVVEFNSGVDVDDALQDVKDAIDKSKSELPNDLPKDPEALELNFSNIPIMFVNISGDYSVSQLKEFGEYLQDEIEALPEISEAPLRGVQEREVKINCDLYQMEARRVSFYDIERAIASENVSISGGNILVDDYRRSVRVVGEFEKKSDIENIIVKNHNGAVVYLRDIAVVEVENSFEETTSYARQYQLPVVTVNVVKRSGENLLTASDKIKEIIAKAQKERFPKDLKITISNDQSKKTRSDLANLENSIISGVILVVLVLLFFLGLRNALFVGVAIPLSMLMSFMILNLFGVTLNLMVLFSLILALGMLVDNGIVVVENIYRHLEEGKKIKLAVKHGVGEVAIPIIASTLTTVMAFVPLAFWGGIIGNFMKFLPITLIITLSSSLFVALVINPALAVIFMKKGDQAPSQNAGKRLLMAAITLIVLAIVFYIATALGALKTYTLANLLMLFGAFILINKYVLEPVAKWFQEKALTWLENRYEKIGYFALSGKKPILFFAATLLLLVGSIALMVISAPKVIFFPENEPVYINIFIEQPIGTDIEATNKLTKVIEKDVIELMKPYSPMVESIIAQVGQGTGEQNNGGGESTPHKAKITVSFVEYKLRNGVSTAEIMEKLRNEVKKYPGPLITVGKNRNGPPVGKPINIEISGEDYDKLIALTADIKSFIQKSGVQGIEELKTDLEVGKPELLVTIDRDAAMRYGLTTSQIAMEIRTALFGKEISKFKDGEDDYKIQLRLKDDQRYDTEALYNKNIIFRNNRGQYVEVPISAVAKFEPTSTYGSVKRKDLDRVVSLYSNITEGYNANEIVAQLRSKLQEYEMPDGYALKFTGEQEEQAKSMAFLMTAMGIAMGCIFLILVTQFNSLIAPFIIIASIIFSTIGVFLGLVVFQMDFVVIMTGIGIISLAGVVVNNAIVLIDYAVLTQQRRKAELGLDEEEQLPNDEIVDAIAYTGKTRLRPVLLTAITTILGLFPLATGLNIDFGGMMAHFDPDIYMGGDNANFWGPMAWTVIFGLTFATFLTLIIVPVMYLLTTKMVRGLNNLNKKR